MSQKYLATFSLLLEGIEALKLMRSLIPFAIILLNFVIGGLVASGRVQPICQSDVQNAFLDIGGYVLIFATSGLSFFHVVKAHSNPTVKSPIASSPVAVDVVKSEVFTDGQHGGVPPSPTVSDEQKISTDTTL